MWLVLKLTMSVSKLLFLSPSMLKINVKVEIKILFVLYFGLLI